MCYLISVLYRLFNFLIFATIIMANKDFQNTFVCCRLYLCISGFAPRPPAGLNPYTSLGDFGPQTSCAHPTSKPIGVASYGALGHVPPFDFQLLNFSGHFRAAQTLTFDSMWLPIQ